MYAASNQSAALTVVAAGTVVPLPDLQSLDSFIPNANSTAFTVPEKGRYLISYRISTTTNLLLSAGVYLNNILVPASLVTPSLAGNEFETSFIVRLKEGDQLSLVILGYNGAVTLDAGVGAFLTAVRLD